MSFLLTVTDSEADTESDTESDAESESNAESPPSIQSSPSNSPPANSPPAEFSDWDGFSDTSFNSASDAFTDNHTDSEPKGIDTSWLYTTVEEQDKARAERRYRRRRNRHIQERDRRRLDRELRELNDDYFDTWIAVEQDQEQDQIHSQMLAEIQGQDTRDQDTSNQDTSDQDTSYQDTRPQKRRYSSEALDSTDLTERRYPLRKRQLTLKAAALL